MEKTETCLALLRLTSSQKAMLAARVARTLLEQRTRGSAPAGTSRRIAADMFGVSPRLVQTGMKVLRKGSLSCVRAVDADKAVVREAMRMVTPLVEEILREGKEPAAPRRSLRADAAARKGGHRGLDAPGTAG